MIGIVLSGHGNFASGLYSSLKLIAGEQERLEVVDFTEEMGLEELHKSLNKAVDAVDYGDGVVIFTDIPGGTPFNQSVLLATTKENVKVISGTNLPALLDGMFIRNSSIDYFVEKILISGKEGLQQFKQKIQKKDSTNIEDGI